MAYKDFRRQFRAIKSVEERELFVAEWKEQEKVRLQRQIMFRRIKDWPDKMYERAKTRAMDNGWEFDLTPDYIRTLYRENCPVFGLKLDYMCRELKPNKASLDRVDNSRGYIMGNVQIICSRANTLKSNATIDDLERILAYMQTHI